jgi:superfamily II DNA or RNA helicase
MKELRTCQRDARDTLITAVYPQKKNGTVVMSPATGKTTMTCAVLYELLRRSNGGWKVLGAVPTSYLKTQWVKSAAEFGIQLDPSGDPVVRSGFHGWVTTYAGLAQHANLFAELARKYHLFFFGDEIHHAGQTRQWGDAVNLLYAVSKYQLALSGTLFRPDEVKIAGIDYDENGDCVADYYFGYSEALLAGYVRPIRFHLLDGEFEWTTKKGVYRNATFDTVLDPLEESERLRVALDPTQDWIKSMIVQADRTLNQIRSAEQPNAGALISCIDQEHAKVIARLIRQVTGENPAMVLSEDSAADKKIERFRRSTHKWLVAVRMVSEGVDIPRLRVLCYGTTILSELYFHQFIGRGMRICDSSEEVCHVFMPNVAPLNRYAKHLDLAVHQWKETLTRKKDQPAPPMPAESYFQPLNSRMLGITPTTIDSKAMAIELEELRRECSKKAAELTITLGYKSPQIFYTHWMKQMGGRSQKVETVTELRRKRDYLDACLRRGELIGRLI